MRYAPIFVLVCLATIADAAAPPAIPPARAIPTAGHDGRERGGMWRETAQMAVLGAGLSYVGLRFGKRKP